MSISISSIYIFIVIFKFISFTSIIRRIDIDNINLPTMSIAKGSKGFEVITLDKNMIGSLSIIADNGTLGNLNEHRLLVDHSEFCILRLILPYQTIFLLRTKKLQQL